MKRTLRAAGLVLLLPLALSGCWTDETPNSAPETSASATPSGSTFEHAGVTVTGDAGAAPTITLAEDFGPVDELDTVDIIEGTTDPAVTATDTLTVHYVGVGEQSRKVFDSSWERGQPASFPLERVIEGWQEGMLGMKAGGRRLLIIPGSMAYEEAGSPPDIGPDETLVFVVDLISVSN